MTKNLMDYTKEELMNIGNQMMVSKQEMSNAKKSTIIAKLEDKAEELSVAIPEPETIIEVKTAKVTDGAPKKMRIVDYPRFKISLECRDVSVKQQQVGLNEYSALIKIGEEVIVPEPVLDLLESLTDTIHVLGNEGNVVPKQVSRFYVKRLK